MTPADIDRIRGLCNRLGVEAAAKQIGIHKTSLVRLLADLELRPTTAKVVQAALERGVMDEVEGKR